MRFLLVTLIYAILFFSDISMNFFEKILFGGIYVLCFLMEIWGIIINRKMGIFKMSKINKSNMFRLIVFLVSFFIISCEASTECGKSKKDNCLVNKESFEKIQEGDSLNIVLDLLGKPFAFDLVDNENGNRRYSWLKYSVVDDPSKMSIQEGIAIEFKGNKVASKEYYDYSSLDK